MTLSTLSCLHCFCVSLQQSLHKWLSVTSCYSSPFCLFLALWNRSVCKLLMSFLLLLSLLRIFPTSVSWWFLTGVWVTARFLRPTRTLLSILTDHKNTVVWMVSTCPLIFKSSSSFNNPLAISQVLNSIRSGCLVEIRWSDHMSISQRGLCVLFSRTNVGFCICHFFVCLDFNFFHNSQWITLPTQSCLVLYSFCANLQHSLIIWLLLEFALKFSLNFAWQQIFSSLQDSSQYSSWSSSGGSPLVVLFPILPVFVLIFWRLFQVYH